MFLIRGYGRFAFEFYMLTAMRDTVAALSDRCDECLVYLSFIADSWFVHKVSLIIC